MGVIAEKLAERSKAAYTLVDVSGLPKDVRDAIVQDAGVGGSEYGIRVVEEFINGPAVSSVYGVYAFDADKWEQAKKDLGIEAEEVDDETVHAGPDPLAASAEEAALRQRAQEAANATAERVRTAEASELQAITGEAPPEPVAAAPAKTTNKAPR